MRRREVLALLGGTATALSTAVRAQQPPMPVVGFLRSTPSEPFAHLVDAFRQGLGEAGYVEGRNVAIEYRWADNHPERLPALAADLVRRQAAVIVGNISAAEAARAASSTIPIVFVIGDDPVKRGLVANLNRPGGNLTGITFFGGGQLGAKRLELLLELVPRAAVVAVLRDPNDPGSSGELPEIEAAARALGRRVVTATAASQRDFDTAFAAVVEAGAGALLVSGGPVFTSLRRELVALAARHAIPAIYDQRDFVVGGGLISYAASFTGAHRQAGLYAGRILKGEKPADMPVLQPTAFELVINLSTAKALGLALPDALLLQADEVIE